MLTHWARQCPVQWRRNQDALTIFYCTFLNGLDKSNENAPGLKPGALSR